jgi:hypothetical protein
MDDELRGELLYNETRRRVTPDDIVATKAKLRAARLAKDKIAQEWYRCLLEGVKESPWYHDDNKPSLYRDRLMAHVAVGVVAIGKGHELAVEGLENLRHLRQYLPNTFATIPTILKEWEAVFSARVDAGIVEQFTLRPPHGAEVDDLNKWLSQAVRG